MWKMFLLPLLLLAFTACQSAPSAPSTAVPVALATTNADATATPPVSVTLQSTTPVAAEAAGTPITLVAPGIGLTVPIEGMGWQVTQVEGERKAVWEVPANSAGWHLNSARPGTAGNMVLSGHHLLEGAVFAPLARGELTMGEQLLITDDQGHTFVYQVSKIGEPLPAIGSTSEEQARAEAYLAPADQAKLTLVTGWPDFSDTHYLFVVADFVGTVQ